MVESYPELYETFRWHVPRGFNLASTCCFQWSGLPGHEQRPALIYRDGQGQTGMTSFAQLGQVSAQLANGLTRLGVIPGDRVVMVLSDPSELLTALFACWAIRAVAVPLKPGTSADALLPRMKHARSQVALIDATNQGEALAAISRCPRIKHIVGLDVYDGRVMSWRGLIARQPATYNPSQCLPSDPALMVWPEHPSPDLASQSAMVLAHQSLIGQLPGFVMAASWFPEGAKQLLTTLDPWDETGLLAAILPALYFGHTVVLSDRLPAPSSLPSQVTHVVSTGASLIDALKSDSTGLAGQQPLAGMVLLDYVLEPDWREQAQRLYGTTPNLATFVSGCGLLIAQSQRKWPEAANSSGRPVPGHCLALVEPGAQVSELQVSRVDQSGQTDPAQFIQAWPVKDALDLSAELPARWRGSLWAQDLGDGCWRVLGHTGLWQIIAKQPVSLWQLEQAVLLDHKVKWAQVAFIPSRKSQPHDIEIWVMIDVGLTHERQFKPWRQALRADITDLILRSLGQVDTQLKIRVGLVDRQAMSAADQASRSPWHTRAYQALIDFL